jgi:hypothetical protein
MRRIVSRRENHGDVPKIRSRGMGKIRRRWITTTVRDRAAKPWLCSVCSFVIDGREPGAAFRFSQRAQNLPAKCPFSPPSGSSLFKSRGPRLPRQTQLIRGSLFGFWVIHDR